MAIKKVSVTKTSQYITDTEGVVTRERIVELSYNWTERDIVLFKKLAKQGGSCNLKGIKYTVVPGERVTNSLGFKDAGAPPMPGPEN